ncbi:hypothetical protein A6D6_02345 [Alcanivorax xiamenensis]|uniref:Uncharacterized protein n=1 Tax=Alcanivorax xiamenensis TaxID=1177156 RepID=A0ABQ6Y7D4_9GAMM|nr:MULTISPECIES: hypothetical protein [Alcanivorax]KAF0805390.1 hypothetical protein A6D6_02345 [Alcanivorax xiamenensis]
MIGNGFAWGRTGYTIMEEGELDPATWQLKISHYLVAEPSGHTVPGRFTLEQARAWIEERESEADSG